METRISIQDGTPGLPSDPIYSIPGEVTAQWRNAEAFMQQIITGPAEYDVVATLNLTGNYVFAGLTNGAVEVSARESGDTITENMC